MSLLMRPFVPPPPPCLGVADRMVKKEDMHLMSPEGRKIMNQYLKELEKYEKAKANNVIVLKLELCLAAMIFLIVVFGALSIAIATKY